MDDIDIDLGSVVGTQGPEGKTLYLGEGEPDSDLGSAGCTYMDTETGKIYKKTSSGWEEKVQVSKGEFYKFSSGVSIRNLLDFYDVLEAEKHEEFKRDMSDIKHLHEWFFEQFLPRDLGNVVSERNLTKIHEEVRSRLLNVANRYGLVYGCD